MKSLRFKLYIQFFADGDQEPPAQPAEPEQTTPNQADVYAEALAEVKENSVPKEDYERIRAERDRLVKLTLEQREPPHPEEKPQERPLDDIRKELFGERLTNYDYVKDALELRSRLISEGKGDPFVSPDSDDEVNDKKIAEDVAQVLQDTLEQCKDNPDLFPAALQLRLKDNQQVRLAIAHRKASKAS